MELDKVKIFITFNTMDWQIYQIIELLGIITLNQILYKAQSKMVMASAHGIWHKHLLIRFFTNLQPKNAKCPSKSKYSIEYLCVNNNLANHLTVLLGANLIMAPSIEIFVWLNKIQNHIKNNKFLELRKMWWAYAIKLENNMEKCAQLNKQQNKVLLTKNYPDALTIIVLKIKGYFNTYVKELIGFIYFY